MNPVRLTQTVKKGGCAAKVAALELRNILKTVQFPTASESLLIGTETFDDAAVYKVSQDLALVQTLDFFTPIVDSPTIFGKIAAANALSDVYAMGGKPTTALAIFAFPMATLDLSIATEVLQGACDQLEIAKTPLVGGHTIDDDSLKFGLSVTGSVHPEKVWSNAGAKPGDHVILTKALGTGTLTAALKRGETTEEEIHDGIQSMILLNRVPELLSDEERTSVHAATDITGFGLGGHALNIAKASGITIELDTESLPVFERTNEFLRKSFLTKAHHTNWNYIQKHTEFKKQDIDLQNLVVDPQTSGGLLLCISPKIAAKIVDRLRPSFPKICRVGTIVEKEDVALRFT